MSNKQAAFVVAYVSNGGNATQAAREAGFSEKSARQIGGCLARKPHVQKAIEAEQRRTLQGRLASRALRVLEDIMNDTSAPAGARVDAAKTVLDRAGMVALREPAQDPYEGPMNEWTLEQLENFIAHHKLL
ncbi:MAG: terminase small subunit, partial [Terriglobia bacterium]